MPSFNSEMARPDKPWCLANGAADLQKTAYDFQENGDYGIAAEINQLSDYKMDLAKLVISYRSQEPGLDDEITREFAGLNIPYKQLMPEEDQQKAESVEADLRELGNRLEEDAHHIAFILSSKEALWQYQHALGNAIEQDEVDAREETDIQEVAAGQNAQELIDYAENNYGEELGNRVEEHIFPDGPQTGTWNFSLFPEHLQQGEWIDYPTVEEVLAEQE